MGTLIHERLGNRRPRGSSHQPASPAPTVTGEHPHPGQVFLRLLWKEYRQLRELWILLAVIIAGIAGFMATRIIIPNSVVTWNLIFLVPGLFSVSCGALFYANEKEQGTDRWLTQWTVSPMLLAITKYLVAILGTALLMLSAFAIVYSLDLPKEMPADQVTRNIAVWTAGLICGFIYTSAISVISGRVLVSAAIGVPITLFSMYLVGEMHDYYFGTTVRNEIERWELGAVGVIFAVLTVLAIFLPPILFTLRLSGKFDSLGAYIAVHRVAASDATFRNWRAPRGVMTALFWKEFRQSRIWIIAIVLFVLWYARLLILTHLTYFPLQMPRRTNFYGDGESPLGDLFLFIMSLVMISAYLIGSIVYASDQRGRRFRYLTILGVHPASVWMLKQSIWLPLVILLIPISLLWSWTGEISTTMLWYPWAVLTTYAVFQLCSLLIPQSIIAIAVGFCASSILLYYSLAMTTLDIPFVIVAIPIPLLLLLSSFILTRSWMEEWSGWKGLLWRASVIVGPVLAVFIAAASFRAFEIPATKESDLLPRQLPDPNPQQVATALVYEALINRADPQRPDLSTFGIYRRDDDQTEVHMGRNQKLIRWRNNKHLVDELIAITSRPEGMFKGISSDALLDSNARRRRRSEFRLLADILLGAAIDQRVHGDWNGAKESYLALFRLVQHAVQRSDPDLREECRFAQLAGWEEILQWAKQWSTTVPEIVAVIDQLKKQAVFSPERVKEWYLADFEIYSAQQQIPVRLDSMLDETYFRSPWERIRARRLADYVHAFNLRKLQSLVDSPHHMMDQSSRLPCDDFSQTRWYRWSHHTPIALTYNSEGEGVFWESTTREYLAALAVVAWKKEHGEMPLDLPEACRKYIGTALADPSSGLPYQIATRGDRFQFSGCSTEDWNRTKKAVESNPNVTWGFNWEPGIGFSIDPTKY